MIKSNVVCNAILCITSTAFSNLVADVTAHFLYHNIKICSHYNAFMVSLINDSIYGTTHYCICVPITDTITFHGSAERTTDIFPYLS